MAKKQTYIVVCHDTYHGLIEMVNSSLNKGGYECIGGFSHTVTTGGDPEDKIKGIAQASKNRYYQAMLWTEP